MLMAWNLDIQISRFSEYYQLRSSILISQLRGLQEGSTDEEAATTAHVRRGLGELQADREAHENNCCELRQELARVGSWIRPFGLYMFH